VFDSNRDSTGHSDRFWALALANYACKNSNIQGNITVESVIKSDFIW